MATKILGWSKDQLTAVAYSDTGLCNTGSDAEIIGWADRTGKREVNRQVREMKADSSDPIDGEYNQQFIARAESRVSRLFGRH